MQLGWLLLLALLVSKNTASALQLGTDYEAVPEPEPDVLALTSNSFDDTLSQTKYVLVEFYAPWCPHCKVLAPEYSAAATALKRSRPGVVLAKVDATEHKALARRFKVKGFPTLKWFRDGVAHEYTGGRSSADIISWVQKKTGVLVQQLNSSADVDTIRAEKTYLLVSFVADVGDKEVKVLQEAAEVLEETFGLVTDVRLATHLGIGAVPPTVTLLRTFEEPMVVLDEPMTVDGIVSFVRRNRRPSMLEFGVNTAPTILQTPYQLLCFGSSEDNTRLQPVLKRAAAALRGADSSVMIVTVAADGKNETASVFQFFGITNSTALPTVRGFTNIDGKTMKLRPTDPADVSDNALVDFGRSLLNGTAAVYYMSQPVPDSNNGPVTIVTGDTFDGIVLDPHKDVLLEVYAPWCHHCKALEPIYEQLGRRFRKIDSVVIAKLDGTANEHPALAGVTQGYPSILFFPATGNATHAKGAPVVYDGAAQRTLPALTKFIKRHAHLPYTLPVKSAAKGRAHPDSELRRRQL